MDVIGQDVSRFLSPPINIDETGLSQAMLEDVVARQLFDSGVLDMLTLERATALSNRVLDSVIGVMRGDGRIEVLGPSGTAANALRYSLTDAGRKFAGDARERSGYVGPAPISEAQYCALIHQQSVHNLTVSRNEVQQAFSDVVIKTELQNKLGAAMHSGKAILIYGPAGAGKTYLCSRLIRLLNSYVYIPYAVVVADSIVRVFDAAIHKPVALDQNQSAWLEDRPDPRMVLCERPYVVSGGELTMDLLEIRRDYASKQYIAPLQMKATHGIYMIDDLGRQRMSTDELFNRWIVPMESGVDYLNLDSGARLELPFDVILIFSTNLLPEDVTDPAFQRRIGHKIGFEYCDDVSYTEIWRQECFRRGVDCDEQLIRYAISDLHARDNRPMLACHPRDLIGMCLDYSRYAEGRDYLSYEALELAWENYFA